MPPHFWGSWDSMGMLMSYCVIFSAVWYADWATRKHGLVQRQAPVVGNKGDPNLSVAGECRAGQTTVGGPGRSSPTPFASKGPEFVRRARAWGIKWEWICPLTGKWGSTHTCCILGRKKAHLWMRSRLRNLGTANHDHVV